MAKEKPYEFLDEHTAIVCEAINCIHHPLNPNCKNPKPFSHKCLWLSIKIGFSGQVEFGCSNHELKEKE